VTQPDDASTRDAAMIKFFTVTVSALFPVDAVTRGGINSSSCSAKTMVIDHLEQGT
jgi:hypothetical protein